MNIELTQDKYALVDRVDYDKLSSYKWCARREGNTYYAARKENYKPIKMHIDILGHEEGKIIDHINGNGLDNRRENLRFATYSENGMNRKNNANSSSKYKGVGWHKKNNNWQARITVNGKLKYLGSFQDERGAASAYNTAAEEYFGEFAQLNVIEEV